MEWNHPLLNHWPLAHPTLVSTSRPVVLNLVPIIVPLSVCALFEGLAIPCLVTRWV